MQTLRLLKQDTRARKSNAKDPQRVASTEATARSTKRDQVLELLRSGAGQLLNGEIFYTLKEAKIVIEHWWRHYNTVRPHSSLGYRPSAPEALVWPATKEIVKMQSLN